MNVAPPAPLAAPGPALQPARALATCVDGILATMLRFLARLGFLGRLINPQAAQIAHLLQSLSTLLTRFAAGDLPPRAAPLPATTLAPSRPRASSPACPLHNAPPCAPPCAPPRMPTAPPRPHLPPCPHHRPSVRRDSTGTIPRHSPAHPVAPARARCVRTPGPISKFTLPAPSPWHA